MNQWDSKELQALNQVATAHQDKNWKVITQILSSMGFKKTIKQYKAKFEQKFCEKKGKKGWSQTQLVKFQQNFDQYGPQWRLIQQVLPGKSQIEIKNKFNGTIKHFLRVAWKLLGNKPSKVIKQLVPKELLQIYLGKGIYTEFKNLLKSALKEMKFQVDKKILTTIYKNQRERFEELFKIIHQDNVKEKATEDQSSSGNQQEKNKTNKNSNSTSDKGSTERINQNISTNQAKRQVQQQQLKWPQFIPGLNAMIPIINFRHNDKANELQNFT